MLYHKSNYSITDSLKETAIVGIDAAAVDDNLMQNSKREEPRVEANTDPNAKGMNQTEEEESVVSNVTSVSVTTTNVPYPSITVVAESSSIRSKTFFSQKKYCFNQIKFTQTNEIPTEYFLGCCSDIFSLFDNFGSSAFLPVKLDIYGNINKLKQKYSSDQKRYHTLQAIVYAEINDKVTNVKNSATDALLWLKRAIWFLKEFMVEFSSKEKPDLTECVYLSYQNSLRQYHNWVVRSIFSIALRSLPTTDTFLQGLANDPQNYLNDKKEFERQIKNEMKVILVDIEKCLMLINNLYAEHKLDK